MNSEDIKNLVGWLQAIYKETQFVKGELGDIRSNVDMIPEIKGITNRGTQDSGDAERKIDDTRNHIDDRMNRLESTLNDLKNDIKDIRSKVDRIKT